MDPKLQTSFIPKKPLTASSASTSGISIVGLITSVIFLVAVVASVSLYFYYGSLDNQIKVSIASLKSEEDHYDIPTIENLIRLNTRIEATKTILHKHVAVTPLFDTLQKTVLRFIRFTDLTFAIPSPDKITLTMNGQALSYASIAFQAKTITDMSKLIRNPVFSSLNLDTSGNITFKFSATLNPLLTSYEANLTSALQNSADDTTAPPQSGNGIIQ